MTETSPTKWKSWMAAACHYCPLCRYGRKHRESWVGRLLHHKRHADHCPFWKAEKEVYGPHS